MNVIYTDYRGTREMSLYQALLINEDENVREVVTRLLEVLVRNKLLSIEEAGYIIKDYARMELTE